MIDSKRLRSADSRASGGGPRVLHLFTAFPQSHGTLRRLEAAVARCGLSLVGRWRIERTASVHSESKTRRVARASLWSARCSSSSQERRALAPPHTRSPSCGKRYPPPSSNSSSSRTLSHTSLSRRLSIASLLPFVAPPLRRLCRAKLPPCRSLMMRRRSLSPTSASRAAHTLRRSLHPFSSLAAAAAAAAASETYNARRPPRAAPHVPPRLS